MDLELITKGKQLSDNDLAILTYLAAHINELDGVSLRKIAQRFILHQRPLYV